MCVCELRQAGCEAREQEQAGVWHREGLERWTDAQLQLLYTMQMLQKALVAALKLFCHG
jgi:hypothetical protein